MRENLLQVFTIIIKFFAHVSWPLKNLCCSIWLISVLLTSCNTMHWSRWIHLGKKWKKSCIVVLEILLNGVYCFHCINIVRKNTLTRRSFFVNETQTVVIHLNFYWFFQGYFTYKMSFRGGRGGRGGGRSNVVTTKLYIGNIPDTCRKSDLQQLFKTYGKVVECDIVKNYGFVVGICISNNSVHLIGWLFSPYVSLGWCWYLVLKSKLVLMVAINLHMIYLFVMRIILFHSYLKVWHARCKTNKVIKIKFLEMILLKWVFSSD